MSDRGYDITAGILMGLCISIMAIGIPLGLGAFWKEGEVITKPHRNPYACIRACNERIEYFEIQRTTAQNILMKGLNK